MPKFLVTILDGRLSPPQLLWTEVVRAPNDQYARDVARVQYLFEHREFTGAGQMICDTERLTEQPGMRSRPVQDVDSEASGK
jgi:hypothetical protein